MTDQERAKKIEGMVDALNKEIEAAAVQGLATEISCIERDAIDRPKSVFICASVSKRLV